MARSVDPETDHAHWYVTHRWKLGLALMALAGLWWRRSRRAQITVDRVSEQWLMEHEFEAGKGPGS
jgi:MYXO-CTERM domain-containing protein